MTDYRSLLERQMEHMHPRPFPLEDVLQRRDRRQLVKRVLAAGVGVAIALLAFAAGSVILRSSPVPAGPNVSTSHGNGALTYISSASKRVVLLDSETGATVPLTPRHTTSFDWSPDGSELAYAHVNGDGDCIVSVLDMRTNERRSLLRCPRPEDGSISTLDWSPDGDRLAFDNALGFSDKNAIEVIDASGGEPVRLTGYGRPFEANAQLPTWSPDGTRIAFESAGVVWVMDADGSHPHEIAEGGLPAWSPDGSTIALLRGRRDPRGPSPNGDPFDLQVWLVDPDGGSGQRGERLAEQRGCCVGVVPSLAWSPDGRKLALAGTGFWVIDVMDGAVRVVERVVAHPAAVQPAWRPAN